MIAILWGRDFETKSIVFGFLIAETSLENIIIHLRVIVFPTYVPTYPSFSFLRTYVRFENIGFFPRRQRVLVRVSRQLLAMTQKKLMDQHEYGVQRACCDASM